MIFASLTTRLEGIVLDTESGLPLADAEISLGGGEYVGLTNAGGRFRFDHLPLGEWSLTVSRVGYQAFDGLTVTVVEDVTRFVRLSLKPQPIVLPGQLVTGVRANENVFTGATAILTSEQIKNSGFNNVAEALASLPGVVVNAGYSSAGTSRVTIRGESGKRVAITLDGTLLTDGVRGETDLSVVPLSVVESIVISRGGSWSDGALGGMVNIKTKRRFPRDRSITFDGGTFANWKLAASISQPWGMNQGLLISAEADGRGDQYSYVNHAGEDTTRTNTGRRSKNFFIKLGGVLPRKMSWNVSGLYYQNERGAPGALHQSRPAASIKDRRRTLTGELSCALPRSSSLALRLSVADFHTTFRDTLTFRAFTQFDETNYRLKANWQNVSLVPSLITLRLGSELEYQKLIGIDFLTPRRSFDQAGRTAYAGWVVTRLDTPDGLSPGWGRGRLSAGLRYDADNRTPSYWAPKFSLLWGWGAPGWFTLTAGWGRSFRRPLLTSLFWKEDAFAQGNPDLLPERSREGEFGIELAPPQTGLTLGTRFFDREVDGYIDWERRLHGVWSPVNLPRVTIIGREDALSFTAFGKQLKLDFFHTLLWSVNRSTERNHAGKFLLYRPKHTYQGKLSCEYRGFRVALDGRWVDRRFIRKQNTKWLPPYRWFDLVLRRSIQIAGSQVSASIKIENITHEAVSLIEGYPLPGRTVSAGMEFSF